MRTDKTSGLSHETKTIIVVLLLLFFTPAGLILMWIWMKWPTWVKILLTVIPFLFVFLIFGFVLWLLAIIFSNPEIQRHMQKNIDISVSQSQQANQISPQQTTQNFYDEYLSCLNKHFQNPSGKTPRQNCSYEAMVILAPQLIEQLTTTKGYDPILCAQNIPNHIYVKEHTMTNNKATITMSADFNSEKNILVELINEQDRGWMIHNIICDEFTSSSHWKTYTDQRNKFTIDYPATWIINPQGIHITEPNINSVSFGRYKPKYTNGSYGSEELFKLGYEIGVTIEKNFSQNLDSYAKEYDRFENRKEYTRKKITFLSFPAYRINGIGLDARIDKIIFKKGTTLYEIAVRSYNNPKEFDKSREDFDKILSTFKLIP